MKTLKIILSILIPILIVGGIVIAQEPNLGLFSDPFLSIQLGDNPVANQVLTTDGTDNIWSSNLTIGNATTTGSLNVDGDFNVNGDTTVQGVTIVNATNTGSYYLGGDLTVVGASDLGTTQISKWLSENGNLGLDLTDDGSNLTLHGDVGGVNSLNLETDGAFFILTANPGPANDYLLASIAETQGADTELNFYEGGTGHNRFWDSGSMRIGGAKNYLCSELTNMVDCDTSGTGADLVVQDDVWAGGSVFMTESHASSTFASTTIIDNLEVLLNATTTGHLTADSTLYVKDGHVGIGTASSGPKLEVYGNQPRIRISDDDGTSYTDFGQNTGGDFIFSRNGTGGTDISLQADGDLIIGQQGNIGIGTASPANKFNVIPSGSIGGSNLANAGILVGTTALGIGIDANEIKNSGNALFIGTIGNYDIDFGTNGATGQVIIQKTTGNVGIGTTNPGAKLVASSTTEQLRLAYDVVNNKYASFTINSDGDLTLDLANNQATTTINDNLIVGSNVLVANAVSGNVGIGITDPSVKLDVSGKLKVTSGNQANAFAIYSGTANSVGAFVSSDNQAIIQISDDDTNTYLSAEGGYLSMGGNTGLNAGNLNINTTNGNVGIGTISPANNLEIWENLEGSTGADRILVLTGKDSGNQQTGDGVGILFNIPYDNDYAVGAAIDAVRETAGETDSSTGLAFSISQNDETLDEAMRIDNSGNVGIGTISPTGKLGIAVGASFDATAGTSSTGSGLVIDNTAITAGSGIFGGSIDFAQAGSGKRRASIVSVQETTDEDQLGIAFFTHPPLSGADNMEEAMRITYTGNVGIGTINPGAKLVASSTTEQLRLNYDQVNNYYTSFTVASDGDMTIDLGTNTATTTFSENLMVTNNLGATTLAVGSCDVKADATTGFLYCGTDAGAAGGISDINDSQLGQLSDVNTTTLDTAYSLMWDGSEWMSYATTTMLMDYELDTFSELQTLVADKTLVNEEDAATWDATQTFSVESIFTTGARMSYLNASNTLMDSATTTDSFYTNKSFATSIDVASSAFVINSSGVATSTNTTTIAGMKCYRNPNRESSTTTCESVGP